MRRCPVALEEERHSCQFGTNEPARSHRVLRVDRGSAGFAAAARRLGVRTLRGESRSCTAGEGARRAATRPHDALIRADARRLRLPRALSTHPPRSSARARDALARVRKKPSGLAGVDAPLTLGRVVVAPSRKLLQRSAIRTSTSRADAAGSARGSLRRGQRRPHPDRGAP